MLLSVFVLPPFLKLHHHQCLLSCCILGSFEEKLVWAQVGKIYAGTSTVKLANLSRSALHSLGVSRSAFFLVFSSSERGRYVAIVFVPLPCVLRPVDIDRAASKLGLEGKRVSHWPDSSFAVFGKSLGGGTRTARHFAERHNSCRRSLLVFW